MLKDKALRMHMLPAALFIFVIALDQFSKKLAVTHLMKGDFIIIDGVIRLHYLENRGAAWGIFENAFWLFFAMTLIVIVAMVWLYAKLPMQSKYMYLRIVSILLCAGAIGNFIDRAIKHYVVDFIYFELIDFPVFNVADIAVTVSVALLAIGLIFKYKDDPIWTKDQDNG